MKNGGSKKLKGSFKINLPLRVQIFTINLENRLHDRIIMSGTFMINYKTLLDRKRFVKLLKLRKRFKYYEFCKVMKSKYI